jgi:hypothetical protein
MRNTTPFAAELTAKLAGDEPLAAIVNWWDRQYRAFRADNGPISITKMSEAEGSVHCLLGVWELVSESETLTEDDPNPNVQESWSYVRQARAALRS